MAQRLSRRRCALLFSVFLLADTLNADLSAAGPLGWLLCLPAALAAWPVYRSFTCFLRQRGLRERYWAGLLTEAALLTAAFVILGRMVEDFDGILRTYNDFALSPEVICFLLLATSLWLARLPGHGLVRTTELFAPAIAVILLWTYGVGLGDCDPGRLLPLTGAGSLHGLGFLFLRVFLQGLAAAAFLEKRAAPGAMPEALRPAAWGSGAVLALFLAKDIMQVGWNMASQYTYPLYALAGLSRSGSGMHIEDLLICALLAARLIKGAMLMGLMGDILKKWRLRAKAAARPL